MEDPSKAPGFSAHIGLCSICKHARAIQHPRGGDAYFQCLFEKTDPSYRKFPALPVSVCDAFGKVGTEFKT
jgi:hypothetical protein